MVRVEIEIEPPLKEKLHFYSQLHDFYGSMLTDWQRNCFVMRYLEDYSLTEIGETLQITPQAVADLLKRSLKSLRKYEDKLGLIHNWNEQQKQLQQVSGLLTELSGLSKELNRQCNTTHAQEITGQMLEQITNIQLLIDEVKNGF